MFATNVFLSLAKIIYPVREPNFERDRPLEILCLGPSRSGTDSLSKALLHLGCNDTYHGLQVVRHRFYDVPQWHRLGQAKLKGNKAFLCAEQFDKILGNCMAITDAPCCIFSEDLLRCYPQAKVVLNKRRDVKAWAQSIQGTLVGIYASWWARFQSYFYTELYWLRLWTLEMLEPLFITPLERNPDRMVGMYEKHFDDIKTICHAEGREYLEWSVEDGWEPLCKFLNKPIPQIPFPQGNSVADFQDHKFKHQDPRERKAATNMKIMAATIAATLIAFIACYQPSM